MLVAGEDHGQNRTTVWNLRDGHAKASIIMADSVFWLTMHPMMEQVAVFTLSDGIRI